MAETNTGWDLNRFVSRFVWTFSCPRKLFADIEQGAPWWQPWIWVSIINILVGWLSLPVQIHLARLNPKDLPPDQVQNTVEAMEKYGFLGLLTAPIVVLLMSVIFALISYLVVSILSSQANFKKYFSLYLYSSIVVSVGTLLSTVVLRMKGLQSIQSLQDAIVSFGPRVFVPPDMKTIGAVLSSLDVFAVWFYILIGVGAAHIFKLTRQSAFLVALPVWLLYVLVAVTGARFGGAV
jgi:hypothetical protein